MMTVGDALRRTGTRMLVGWLLVGCAATPAVEESPALAPDAAPAPDAALAPDAAPDAGRAADAAVASDARAADAGNPPVAIVPRCPGSTRLPTSAPELVPGVWKNISPPEVPFRLVPNTFTQGIALDPCNPAVLYVGVNGFDPKASKGGVYKSTDAGSTWTRIGTPNLDEPVRIRIDPKNPQHLYVGDGVRGGTMGFWVSHDGGNTWTKPKSWSAVPASIGIKTSSGMDDVYDVAVDPADFNHLLVSFHSPWSWNEFSRGSGVLESKDGGETWIVHQPFPGMGHGNNIWFLSNSTTWLLGTQGKGYWRTTDSGANWKQVATNDMAHGGGSLYRSKTGALYASGMRVMRSLDDGLTWMMLGAAAGYNAIIGDGTRLYTRGGFGSASMLTAPEEGGTPWTEHSPQKHGAAPFEMVFDPANDIIYSASWGDGVYALKVKR